MSSGVLSLLVAVGVSIWLYSRFFARRSGEGNMGPAAIGTAVVGIVLFIILYLTLTSLGFG
jgi:hypothetical protein